MTSCAVATGATLVLTLGDIKSSVTAYAPSLRYMRKMLPLIAHNIVYHRIDLEENLFIQKSINDFEYKTFKPKTKHRITSNVYHWCRSLADMIPEKCIKHIYLLLMKKEDNTVIENYKFTLEYSNDPEITADGATLLAHTKSFFAVISALSNHTKLIPDGIKVLFEVEHNENGPARLPPNFEIASAPSTFISKISSSQYISLATINTGYHSLACDAHGEIFHQSDGAQVIEIDDDEECISEKEDSPEVSNKNDILESPTSHFIDIIDAEYEEAKRRKTNEEDEMEEGTQRFPSEASEQKRKYQLTPIRRPTEATDMSVDYEDDEEDAPLPLDKFRDNAEIDCTCGLALSLGISGTVACMVCPRLQHVVCAGFEKIESMPRSFICVNCGTRSRPITDFNLKGKKPGDLMFYSRMRLVIAYCLANKKYPEELIEKWEAPIRKRMKKYIANISGFQMDADNTISVDMCDDLKNFLGSIFYHYSMEWFPIPESMTL